jgi:hypothetical protein
VADVVCPIVGVSGDFAAQRDAGSSPQTQADAGGSSTNTPGRGLAVYLSEMDDLASGTSSRSSGLIHGGLRYLEYYDFRLVRKALIEREVLLPIALHIRSAVADCDAVPPRPASRMSVAAWASAR